MGLFGRRKPKEKKIVKITNGDEMMAAISDVYSTPFGGVGQHIHYQVEKGVLDNSKYYEGWELRLAVSEVLTHPRSRIDVSAVADQALSPIVDSGKWNYETGEMEHPDTSVSPRRNVSLPEFPAFNFWTIFFTILLLTWTPLHWWLESKGIYSAVWWNCYMNVTWIVMIGLSHLMAELKRKV